MQRRLKVQILFKPIGAAVEGEKAGEGEIVGQRAGDEAAVKLNMPAVGLLGICFLCEGR